ncbi:hypothetical protein [Billgrantia antri]|uniref:Uncharacterized protein n=1 Tax=Billgrantia antri TaxID=2846777 RepID=A0ABS6ZT51_9GAMM|nr:hypothetical protein [Halomonas antri]MBW6393261.1 hypothetical protein [Halomonas antri]
MTTQTLPFRATATQSSAPLGKRIRSAAYRLLERMTESAYEQYKPILRNYYL